MLFRSLSPQTINGPLPVGLCKRLVVADSRSSHLDSPTLINPWAVTLRPMDVKTTGHSAGLCLTGMKENPVLLFLAFRQAFGNWGLHENIP